MCNIAPVSLRVAHEDGEDTQKYSLSRTWMALCNILHLTAGTMYLVNVSYLVADTDLAVKYVTFGLQVLHNCNVDTNYLLYSRRYQLYCFRCWSIRAATDIARGGHVNVLTITCIKRLPNESLESNQSLDNLRRCVAYFQVCEKQGPFRYLSLVEPIYSSQSDELQAAFE